MKKVLPVLLFNLLLCLFVSAQNVGIGVPNPTSKLDVAGTVHATGTLTVDNSVVAGTSVTAGTNLTVGANATIGNNVLAGGNINAAGDVTAHGGGVLYNTVAPAGTNMKVYYRTAAFTVTGLAPNSVSIEGQVNIGGGFTAPPMVFIGDITANAGVGATPGPLYQLQLVPYGATATSFKIRVLNTSNSTISQSITWNIMCIGR